MADEITAIKALANCRASGDALVKGRTYKVPGDISVRDAGILVTMGRAEDAGAAKARAKAEAKVKAEAKAKAKADGEVSADAFAMAVKQLPVDNKVHWTDDGQPEIESLQAAGLSGITAEQRDALWAEYQQANV